MERPTVLVVAGDEWARDIVTASMGLVNVHVMSAPTAPLALATLRRALAMNELRDIALVIGELYMPAEGEPCLLRALKQDRSLARVPYLVYSAYAMPDDREWARTNGCDAYLAKPAGPRTLIEAVSRFIDPFRRGAGAADFSRH